MPRTAPPGHTPRFTAYSSRRPAGTEAFVFAQYACQSMSADQAAQGAAALAELFDEAGAGPDRPDVLDRGSFVDTTGAHNVVWLAYWFAPQAHDRWQRSEPVRTAWERLPAEGPVGHWREVSVIPAERRPCTPTGARTTRPADCPGTRRSNCPRLRCATTGAPAATASPPRPPTRWNRPWPAFEPRATQGTLGRRVTVEVPGNVALIRTAQNWSAATLYREKYLADVKPVKDRGVDFLATHPDSGCITARNFVEEPPDGAPLPCACAVAWFAPLDHLLTWCRSHRTHLEIYASFCQMVGGGEGPLDVAFRHEVSVLPSGSVTTEYVNCHPGTGYLPLSGK